jgi:hypothetical protein
MNEARRREQELYSGGNYMSPCLAVKSILTHARFNPPDLEEKVESLVEAAYRMGKITAYGIMAAQVEQEDKAQ